MRSEAGTACRFFRALSQWVCTIGVFGTDGLDIDDNIIHFTVGEGNMIIFWSNNLSFSDSLECKLWSHGVQLVFLQKWKWPKFVLTWELLNCMWPLIQILEECTQYHLFVNLSHFTFFCKAEGENVVP